MSDPVSTFAQALPYAVSLLAGLEGLGRGGLALNVSLTLCAVPAALVLGVVLGTLRVMKVPVLAGLAMALTEVSRSGVLSVNRAELEAARLAGLSRLQTAAAVLAPQAMRRMVPALLAVTVSLFKDSSVVFVIGLIELTQTGMIIASRHPDLLPAMYAFMGLGYMAVSLILTRFARSLERRAQARLAGGSRLSSGF